METLRSEVKRKITKINNDFEQDFDIYRCLGDRLKSTDG